MSHHIGYEILSEDTTKADMLGYLNSFAYDPKESGGYHGDLTLHPNHIYANYKEAEEAIKSFDTGNYSDHAVKFYYLEESLVKHSKALEVLTDRKKKLIETRDKFKQTHNIQNFKAKLITCNHCESKIAKDYLNSYLCPVCRSDLRADYVVEKIKYYNEKIWKLTEEIESLKYKDKNSLKVKWLLKYEYHE